MHIGGVRTALFNWLYSKNQNGNFYLRIEDTDKERSKEEYKSQIIKSLQWIGINHDGTEYIQSQKIDNHIKVANELLKKGSAYRCYCSTEEIESQKKGLNKKKLPIVIVENGSTKMRIKTLWVLYSTTIRINRLSRLTRLLRTQKKWNAKNT